MQANFAILQEKISRLSGAFFAPT